MKLIFVEDDPFILMCTTEALVSQGFEVVTASRGEEALALLSDTAGCLLMMLDVRLAGRIDGWEVARCARAAHPNIAIVYTTTADRFAFERESVDRSVLLQKPYTLNRAVSAAREACQMVDEGA